MGQLVVLEERRERRSRPPLEKRLTKGEVAQLLGVSSRTVENWMRRGMPFEKPFPHGSVRFVGSEVEGWLRGA